MVCLLELPLFEIKITATTIAAATITPPTASNSAPPLRELGGAFGCCSGSAAGAGCLADERRLRPASGLARASRQWRRRRAADGRGGRRAARRSARAGSGSGVGGWLGLGCRLGSGVGSGAAASTGISGSGPLLRVPSSDATTRAHARSAADSARPRRVSSRDHLRELAEQVVGDQRAPFRRNARAGPERVKRGQRPLADCRTVDREHLRDLVVAAAPLQHELEHGPLVGRQTV